MASGSGPSDEEDEFLSVSDQEEVEELTADVSKSQPLMAVRSIHSSFGSSYLSFA